MLLQAARDTETRHFSSPLKHLQSSQYTSLSDLAVPDPMLQCSCVLQ